MEGLSYKTINQEHNLENKEEEKTFKKYIEDLNLKPKDFKKVILDVGAGKAYFAKWAKDHKISSQIYSLEPFEEMSLKKNTIISTTEDIAMPNKFFDLIVSNAAIPNIYLNDNAREKVEKSFSEMLRVLKNGGEIRLARVSMEERLQAQYILTDSIKESLKKFEDIYNLEVKIINTQKYNENHNKKDSLAENFLITLKKPL